MKAKNKRRHKCPVCGKLTFNKSVCSQACYHKQRKESSTTSTNKIPLDNRNLCGKCKKPMPMDRYSMYCEECEMHLED